VTDHHDQANQPRDDTYGRELEKRRQLEEWQARKKVEADQRVRLQKQAELQAYLQRREEDWRDHTGSQPPADVMAQWRQQYLDGLVAKRERERASKLSEAYREFPWSPS
jgi:hypothetical protein